MRYKNLCNLFLSTAPAAPQTPCFDFALVHAIVSHESVQNDSRKGGIEEAFYAALEDASKIST